MGQEVVEDEETIQGQAADPKDAIATDDAFLTPRRRRPLLGQPTTKNGDCHRQVAANQEDHGTSQNRGS